MKQNTKMLNAMKGQLGLSSMWEAGIGFVVIAVILVVGTLIIAEFDQQTNDTNADAVIADAQSAIGTMSDFLPLIAISIVGVIVLVLVLRGLGSIKGRGSGE